MIRLRLPAVVTALLSLVFPSMAQKDLGNLTTKAPQPAWVRNAVIYEANLRQGTPTRNFRGLQMELPRLKDLGVDVVWLMPIHPISEKNRKGTLGSYYAVRDYKAVNPEFGTLDELKELVNTAHNLGMKVIIDEVCNHSGCDNAWVTEHPEFYAKNEKGEMYGPYDWTDTYKFDYSNPAMRAAMIDALKYWVEEADIDGFRFDVAGEVPTDFWVDARNQLEQIKPVFFLAEASKPELMAEAFDADYAWPMKDTFGAIAATKGVNSYAKAHGQTLPESNAQAIPELLKKQKKEYPRGAIHMQMVTNHDLNSWEGTEYERFGPALGAFAVLSYTLPGVPMLYTGQEVGFDHAFEFFETDAVQPDYTGNEVTVFYEMLNALRHGNGAFDAGRDNEGAIEFLPTESEDVLAFTRQGNGGRALVVVNLSPESRKVAFKGSKPSTEGMMNYFAPAITQIPKELGAWEYVVYTTPLAK